MTKASVYATLLFLIHLIPLPASAAGIPTLSVPGAMDNSGVVALNPVMDYVSVDGAQTIHDVLSMPDGSWTPVDGLKGFGYSDRTLWFRLRLQDLKSLQQSTYVRLDFPHHDSVHFALISDQRVLTKITTGDSRPFGTRPVDNSAFLLPLSEFGQNELDLYVGVSTPGSIVVPLDLVTEDALQHHEKIKLAWFAGYFAVIGIIFLNNLMIFFFVRDRTYLYYLTYVLAVAFLVFLLRGAAFQYLWPDRPELNNQLVMVTTPTTLLLAALFVSRFLNLREVSDRFDYILVRGFIALFSLMLLSTWVMPYHIQIHLNLITSIVAVVWGFYLGIKYSLRGYRAARLFALAWFVYLFFVGIYILEVAGFIQPTLLTRNAFVIGSAIELTLLSMAFADRFNQEKQQRIVAQTTALETQQHLNDQLDLLVRERTRELELANRQLERLSLSDPLTGLANRRHFDQQAQLEVKRAQRVGSPLSVAIIDVDYFKRVNDTYGHDVGDRCLIEIGHAIQGVANRSTDVVARFGGEEIALVLPDCDQGGARTVAERIRQSIAGLPINTTAGSIKVTASVGVATAESANQLSLGRLLKAADNNLYEAKGAGRNRVVSTVV